MAGNATPTSHPMTQPAFLGERFLGLPMTPGRWAWLFILPCLLGLAVFTYLPTLASFTLSFTYWNLLGAPRFVGVENYLDILSDPLFWQTFFNTVAFVVFVTLFEVGLGLFLAVQLNRLAAGTALFRTGYFLPVITPMVSVALVWGWLYEPEVGAINQLLSWLSGQHVVINWLNDPNTALFSVIILQVWKSVGYNVVLFLAGLQGVPASVYDSAQLDGASPWQTFWRITLPLVTPTLFFVAMMSMINSFQVFDSIYLLTEGGPQHSTELMVYWMFKNAFEFYKVGPACAIAYVIFLVILALTLTQWQLRKRWVMYEDEVN